MDLDSSAWDRWIAYRIAIKKPLKPMSEDAARLKLSRYGADQAAVVDQSIANQWTGLFDLRKEKTTPEKKGRTREEKDTDSARFSWLNTSNAQDWDRSLKATPIIAKLLLADALLARYDAESDQGSVLLAEKREWLKTRVAELLREADAGEVLNTYALKRLVLRLFSGGGIRRLEQRRAEAA